MYDTQEVCVKQPQLNCRKSQLLTKALFILSSLFLVLSCGGGGGNGGDGGEGGGGGGGEGGGGGGGGGGDGGAGGNTPRVVGKQFPSN